MTREGGWDLGGPAGWEELRGLPGGPTTLGTAAYPGKGVSASLPKIMQAYEVLRNVGPQSPRSLAPAEPPSVFQDKD